MLRSSYVNAVLGLLIVNGVGISDVAARSLLHHSRSEGLHEQTGVASFYGDELQGHKTASGRRFDAKAFTAASLTLPLDSKAEVTSLKTGLSITVTIIDRGPFSKARVIDLSRAAAEEIGITAKEGLGMVIVRPLRSARLNAHDRL